MMTTTTSDPLSDRLHRQLLDLEARRLRRRLRTFDAPGPRLRDGQRTLVNFASNDYLALSQHPHLRRAAIAAIERFGVGAGASRLIAGHLETHEQLEQRFARFKHAEAALLFATGYTANLAVLTTLAQRGDVVLIDKLTHASLIDAARACDAEMRTYRHLDYDHLEHRLKKCSRQCGLNRDASPTGRGHVFIVTDSVFSMDGDTADLRAVCELAERYGAATVVDEAHATGILGPHGEGLAAAQGVADRVTVTVSTASKALGGLGGIVTASQTVIETLINKARAFIYTTAPPPAQIAALDAALDVIRDEPQRRSRLHALADRLRTALDDTPFAPPPAVHVTPILPVIVGQPDRALALAAHLERQGLLGVAIRPPTVAPGSARVRLSLRADHDDGDLDRLIAALRQAPIT